MAQAIAKVVGGDVLLPDIDELDITNLHSVGLYIYQYKPDVVINCAGYIKPDTVQQSDTGEWIKQIEVNLVGTYLVTREALQKGAKVIINIASTSGMGGRPNWSAYCASKAGVISLTQSLAEEGVEAYAISPHRTATRMRKELFPNEKKSELMNPNKIGKVVKDILNNKYNSGDNIVVGKNGIEIHN